MVTAIRKGFTLVELLIVITILVILGIFIVLLINPAEILAKSRDSQRISDLATMKGAMQLFLTDTTVNLTTLMSDKCATVIPIPETDNAALPKVYASLDVAPETTTTPFTNHYSVFAASVRQKNDGTGWVPIDFRTTGSGAPIESLPIDPSADNTSTTLDITKGTYYRFGCYSNGGKFEYEFDAGLESAAYGPKASDGGKGANDGGNANATTSPTTGNNRYETGSNLTILGATANLNP